MANIKSEQITKDYSLVLDFDQPLSILNIRKQLETLLGKENCFLETVGSKKVFCYRHDDQVEVLLLAAITYLGGNGQHPIYKKRMQLKKWYKEIAEYYEKRPNYHTRFIGVYHYQNNLIITEFIKDSYLKRKMNSSAAHVYINDLYQAMKEGIFKRIDQKKNTLITIQASKLKEYLNGTLDLTTNDLFTFFEKFNQSFKFNQWISAKTAIQEMHEGNWNKWKETEWPGWYLEFKIDQFIKKYRYEQEIQYIGSSHKKEGELDFDLWCNHDQFYGDLKASDCKKNEAPGNDKVNFLECIHQYNKFWYVIYEHETIKDSKETNYEATKFRTNYIREHNEWPKGKPWDELSYHSRMKNAVKFIKMYIIELNQINYQQVLSNFPQGKQSNGDKRKPKFKITKKNIDNFIVFSEDFSDLETN